MARKRDESAKQNDAQPIGGDGKTESVRVAADLAKIATMLAVHFDQSVAEVLDPILRGPLTDQFKEVWNEVGEKMGLGKR